MTPRRLCPNAWCRGKMIQAEDGTWHCRQCDREALYLSVGARQPA